MTNADYAMEEYRDIETLNVYRERLEKGYEEAEIMRSIHAKSRDNARTPMQWTDGANAGFTTGTPWMKVNPNYTEINAEVQVQDETSIFHCYRALVGLRREYAVFTEGSFEMLCAEDTRVFAYQRTTEREQLLVICNFFGERAANPLPGAAEGMRLLIGNYAGTDEEMLQPYEARMYYACR